MKILISLLCATLMISCQHAPIQLDYCAMIAEDQTFVNTDKSDMEKFNADKMKRAQIFKKNFGLIMQQTQQEGFPYVSMETYPSDSCKYWAVSMTMIHTAQSSPEVFFSEKYARIFKSELDKGNMTRNLLEQSCVITAKTIELCEKLRPQIQDAINLWEIDDAIFSEAQFVQCE